MGATNLLLPRSREVGVGQPQLLDDALIDLLPHRPLGHPLNEHSQHDVVRVGVLPLRTRLEGRRLTQSRVQQVPRLRVVILDLEDIAATGSGVGVLGQATGVLEELTHRDPRGVNTLTLDEAGQVGLDRLIKPDLALLDHLHDHHGHEGLRVRPDPHLTVHRRSLPRLQAALAHSHTRRLALAVAHRRQRRRITGLHQPLGPGLQALSLPLRRRSPGRTPDSTQRDRRRHRHRQHPPHHRPTTMAGPGAGSLQGLRVLGRGDIGTDRTELLCFTHASSVTSPQADHPHPGHSLYCPCGQCRARSAPSRTVQIVTAREAW